MAGMVRMVAAVMVLLVFAAEMAGFGARVMAKPKNRNDFEQEGTEVTEDQSFEAGIEAHSISPLE